MEIHQRRPRQASTGGSREQILEISNRFLFSCIIIDIALGSNPVHEALDTGFCKLDEHDSSFEDLQLIGIKLWCWIHLMVLLWSLG
ncbi:hypothetical protein SUGI_0285700 [Cryptomeria japonica]|nr:hypothetical protein SUGI_0285700 [Cryptomeria japonica]